MVKPFIVVVLYKPTIEQVKDKLRLSFEGTVIFIDNTSHPNKDIESLICSTPNCSYFPLYRNEGIAKAQNIGIKVALENGATHIIFFDQDSVVGDGYGEQLTKKYEELRLNQIPIGILGPKIKSVYNQDSTTPKSIDGETFKSYPEIISSGCCVDKRFINEVGGLDNSLFIDSVDFEWCWRAKQNGYVVGQTESLCLLHRCGESELASGDNRWVVSSPFRYFYQGRNYIWLSRRNYVPRSFKRGQLLNFLKQSFIYPFRLKNGLKITYNLWKGILYGLTHKNTPDFSI
ncbi:MAG: glycosyltransferase family 2 protein [Rikenellaceae bacterium]|nr:glycosyltransferase family 2 protein [Rikenellaceae bacterium]MCC8112525.1 glycosyltransferase family 2 protein [Bacteroidales bacterium]